LSKGVNDAGGGINRHHAGGEPTVSGTAEPMLGGSNVGGPHVTHSVTELQMIMLTPDRPPR
jgi:hypothetical protein